MIRILMVSAPGGDRGPANAYQNHINALDSSSDFLIKGINEIQSEEELQLFDVFWFSVRFHPNLYFELKNRFPDKVFWMGPNVLFEKAEIGPSDDWESWFVNNVSCDVYTNKADFYVDRAVQYFKGSKKYEVLKNCLNLESYNISREDIINSSRETDVLVYYKNRRIDYQLDDLYPIFLQRLQKLGLKYEVIEYGKYARPDYFEKLLRSKLCVWLSIEDFCANAQLEAQYLNVPVLGTKYNNTDSFDESLNVDAATMTNRDWIRWKGDMPGIFIDGIESYFSETVGSVETKPLDFVLQNYSYDAYAQQILRILS